MWNAYVELIEISMKVEWGISSVAITWRNILLNVPWSQPSPPTGFGRVDTNGISVRILACNSILEFHVQEYGLVKWSM